MGSVGRYRKGRHNNVAASPPACETASIRAPRGSYMPNVSLNSPWGDGCQLRSVDMSTDDAMMCMDNSVVNDSRDYTTSSDTLMWT